jgi:predicted DNA-binding transcriptional regulator AlpA
MSTKPRVTAESPHEDGQSLYITIRQLAERWNLPEKTVYNMRYDGKLPAAIRRGRNVLFLLTEIEAMDEADRAAEREAAEEREHQMRPPEAAVA